MALEPMAEPVPWVSPSGGDGQQGWVGGQRGQGQAAEKAVGWEQSWGRGGQSKQEGRAAQGWGA